MDEEKFSAFPYITRKMLAFESGVSFDLEVVTASKTATEIEVTGMTREGPFKYSLKTDGATAVQTTIFRIPDVPIFLTVKTAAVAASVNDIYAMIYLRASQTRVQLLCQGFLGQLHGINFPNQVPMSPLQQRGLITVATSADPAAGADLTHTVPAGEYWKVKQIQFSFTTNATVADRSVQLAYRDPGAGSWYIMPAEIQTASKEVGYHFFEGAALKYDAVSLRQTIPLPADTILPPGSRIITWVTNMQAGDNLDSMRMLFQLFYSA